MIFIIVSNVSELDAGKWHVHWKILQQWRKMNKHLRYWSFAARIFKKIIRNVNNSRSIVDSRNFHLYNDLNFHWLTLKSYQKVNCGVFINFLELLSALTASSRKVVEIFFLKFFPLFFFFNANWSFNNDEFLPEWKRKKNSAKLLLHRDRAFLHCNEKCSSIEIARQQTWEFPQVTTMLSLFRWRYVQYNKYRTLFKLQQLKHDWEACSNENK